MADYAPLIRPTLAGAMRPVISEATAADAEAVQNIITAIPWISDATKSNEGFIKTKERCVRREVFVVKVNSTIVAIMFLKHGAFAESKASNVFIIPLIATTESERRRGHARRLVRKAKQVAAKGAIQAHAENAKSVSLLISEGFTRVEGEVDMSGHPLYEWIGKLALAT